MLLVGCETFGNESVMGKATDPWDIALESHRLFESDVVVSECEVDLVPEVQKGWLRDFLYISHQVG